MSGDLELDLGVLEGLAPDERRAAVRALGEWRSLQVGNPLLSWVPHSVKQAELLASDRRFTLVFAGNRFGKTTSGVVRVLAQCVDVGALPEHLRGLKRWHDPFRCYVVTRDFRASHQVVLDKFKALAPRDQLRGGSFSRAYDKQDMRLWFRNGSWVQFMSQQQEVEAFGGIDLHMVWFDEEPLHDHGYAIYEECVVRLTDYVGEMLFTMTPQHGMSWVFDKIYLPWERGERPNTACFFGSTTENSTLDPRGVKDLKALWSTMSDQEREAREHGRFVAFEGLIYPEWDPVRHMVPQGAVENPLYVIEAIDPSDMRNAAGVLWLAVEPAPADGERRQLPVVTVIGEWKREGCTIDDVCDAIFEMRGELGVSPSWTVIDPAARNRKAQTGISDQAAYAQRGVFTRPGNNARGPGFSRVRALMQLDRLRVMAHCRELPDELRRYRWTAPRRSEHAPKAEPVKRNDHLVDPLRYGILSIPGLEPRREEASKFTPVQAALEADLERQLAGRGAPSSEHGPGFFR